MVLNYFISVEAFVHGLQGVGKKSLVRLLLRDLLLENPDLYGFEVLRKAISKYEAEQSIPIEESKSRMPFFRQYQRRLIGPEWTPFVASFYEKTAWRRDIHPCLRLTFDAERLSEYCLNENVFFFRCKYDEQQSLKSLEQSLEREYNKVAFDEKNTGFDSDSRFVSLLYNAALEICPVEESERGEWRMALFKTPEETSYCWEKGALRTFSVLDVPLSCLVGIELKPDYREMSPLYTTIIGLMKQCGWVPERLLTGLMED